MKQLSHFIKKDKWGRNMPYVVEYYDDEISPKKWKQSTFGFIGGGGNFDYKTGSIIDKEVYRAQGGKVQPIRKTITEDKQEAEQKLAELKAEGWKARIKKTNETQRDPTY